MKLQLNDELLRVLCALSNKKALAISESQLGLINDWTGSLKEYFYSLPKDLITKVGLVQNNYCYEAIERFKIPHLWLETEAAQLCQFEFGY